MGYQRSQGVLGRIRGSQGHSKRRQGALQVGPGHGVQVLRGTLKSQKRFRESQGILRGLR